MLSLLVFFLISFLSFFFGGGGLTLQAIVDAYRDDIGNPQKGFKVCAFTSCALHVV